MFYIVGVRVRSFDTPIYQNRC